MKEFSNNGDWVLSGYRPKQGEIVLRDGNEEGTKFCSKGILKQKHKQKYLVVKTEMQKVVDEDGELIQVSCPQAIKGKTCLENCPVEKLAKKIAEVVGIKTEVEFLKRNYQLPSEVYNKKVVPLNLEQEKKRMDEVSQ